MAIIADIAGLLTYKGKCRFISLAWQDTDGGLRYGAYRIPFNRSLPLIEPMPTMTQNMEEYRAPRNYGLQSDVKYPIVSLGPFLNCYVYFFENIKGSFIVTTNGDTLCLGKSREIKVDAFYGLMKDGNTTPYDAMSLLSI